LDGAPRRGAPSRFAAKEFSPMSAESDSEKEEAAEAALAASRPAGQDEIEVAVVEAARAQAANPVHPVRLGAEDSFFFRCHRGVACWNKCCHGADVTLSPADILVLARHLGLRPAEFLARYTVPAEHERSGLPVAKLKMGGDDGQGPCSFVTDEGCSVYAARPLTCRYYPLGVLATKLKESERKEDMFFLVKEPHCLGHLEAQTQTVEEFRREQGVVEYDEINRGWTDIMMKMASWKTLGGPGGRDLSPQTKRMFFMATTDVDAFRNFVFSTRFLTVYDIPADAVEAARQDDVALLQLAFAWLKNVLFNEPTVRLKEEVLQSAIAAARAGLGAT
jgi:hypothetical protein